MKLYAILVFYFFALAPLLIEEGESVIWVVGASTTVSLGGLILGGLLLKAGAAGIIGLASVNYICAVPLAWNRKIFVYKT